LYQAGWRKQIDMAKFLVEQGADINLIGDGHLPIDGAIYGGDKETVEAFIVLGAKLNITNQYSETPLHSASKFDIYDIAGEIVKLLIEHGADVNAVTISKQTPLHIAIISGHQKAAEILLDHGTDVNARNDGGDTPLHIAAYQKNTEMMTLLLEHGADPDSRDWYGYKPSHYSPLPEYTLKVTASEVDSAETQNTVVLNIKEVLSDDYQHPSSCATTTSEEANLFFPPITEHLPPQQLPTVEFL
jgi:ankyrin repeat protein